MSLTTFLQINFKNQDLINGHPITFEIKQWLLIDVSEQKKEICYVLGRGQEKADIYYNTSHRKKKKNLSALLQYGWKRRTDWYMAPTSFL